MSSRQSRNPEALRISDSEWAVMKTLWRLGPSTAGQIIADLSERTDWKPKTIQTLVRRLVQKEVLEFEQQGRDRLYRAAISEQDCTSQASHSFLDRVFDGKLAPFLANFTGDGKSLSEADLAELKKLLKDSNDD
ncbi:MAG: BlaI/MecI/CopY family transcriptional regulator [Akkermansiaceae bacterium]